MIGKGDCYEKQSPFLGFMAFLQFRHLQRFCVIMIDFQLFDVSLQNKQNKEYESGSG